MKIADEIALSFNDTKILITALQAVSVLFSPDMLKLYYSYMLIFEKVVKQYHLLTKNTMLFALSLSFSNQHFMVVLIAIQVFSQIFRAL